MSFGERLAALEDFRSNLVQVFDNPFAVLQSIETNLKDCMAVIDPSPEHTDLPNTVASSLQTQSTDLALIKAQL